MPFTYGKHRREDGTRVAPALPPATPQTNLPADLKRPAQQGQAPVETVYPADYLAVLDTLRTRGNLSPEELRREKVLLHKLLFASQPAIFGREVGNIGAVIMYLHNWPKCKTLADIPPAMVAFGK